MGRDAPRYTQNVNTYSAALDREVIRAESKYKWGVYGSGDLKVTQRAAGANYSVDIAMGRVLVPESTSTDSLGWRSYLCGLSGGAENYVLGNPPVSNSRYDIVYASVRDSTVSGGSDDWVFSHTEGTAAASPTIPALPVQATLLAVILRTAGEASILNAAITDKRDFAGPRAETRMVRTSVTSQPASTTVIQSFTGGTEVEDTLGMWDSGDPTKFTATIRGRYEFYAHTVWGNSNTGDSNITAWFEKNGDTTRLGTDNDRVVNAFGWHGRPHGSVFLEVGDYLQLKTASEKAMNDGQAGVYVRDLWVKHAGQF